MKQAKVLLDYAEGDALVAAGKIKPEDRLRVKFLVHTIVESPQQRANVDDIGYA